MHARQFAGHWSRCSGVLQWSTPADACALQFGVSATPKQLDKVGANDGGGVVGRSVEGGAVVEQNAGQ